MPLELAVMIVLLGAFTGTTAIVCTRMVFRHRERMGGLAPGMPNDPSQVDGRLIRIEQAVEAMSVELERVGEGQRFITKLLAERGSDAAAPMLPPSGAPGRSFTPH